MASDSDFDMRQANEMWSYFLNISRWLIIATIVILVQMAYFLTGK
jgi:hypothetical protein